MKLCMPTSGNSGLKELVYSHFGSAKYFTIYDTETKEIKIVGNDNQHHSHGACQPLAYISDYNVDAILTSGMGRRAVQILNNGGVKVYLLEGNTVEEAIKKLEANELTELTIENACGGHGNGCH